MAGELITSPIVAVVTPFQESGEVDFAALTDYLNMLADMGISSILVAGTTGEFASLGMGERRTVAEHCRGVWSGTLLVHVGASAFGDAVELAGHADEFADGLAVINPYFFAEAPPDGVAEYFRRVLAVSDRPTLLYNFPRHTQTPLPPAVVQQLAQQFPNVVGVKDSGKDREAIREYTRLCPRLAVYLGDDRLVADAAEVGAVGVVSGAGGPVAELPAAITDAVAAGDHARAHARQRDFDVYSDERKQLPLSDIAFVKAALGARLPGFPSQVRPPLMAASLQQQQRIHGFMESMRPVLAAARTAGR